MYRFIKKIEWASIRIINIFYLIYSIPNYLKVRKSVKENRLLKNKETGKKCFILLGGLSAKNLDLAVLENEDVITANHFFRAKENNLVKPKYHIVTDSNFYNVESNIDELISLGLKSTTFFLNGRYFKNEKNIQNIRLIYPLYRVAGDNIKLRIDKVTSNFSTVTLNAIQTAMFLGYQEINLIGFDLPPGSSMPHFYDESEVERAGVGIQRQKVEEYEYCNLFWGYTNCLHESYALERISKISGVKIYNTSGTSFVRAFQYKDLRND
jgi:hypothetical protein